MKKSVLTRYRVMAYITAVLLVLLTVGVIGKRLLDLDGFDGFVTVVGIAHGWLYVLYLIFAFDLGSKMKMPVGRRCGYCSPTPSRPRRSSSSAA